MLLHLCTPPLTPVALGGIAVLWQLAVADWAMICDRFLQLLPGPANTSAQTSAYSHMNVST